MGRLEIVACRRFYGLDFCRHGRPGPIPGVSPGSGPVAGIVAAILAAF
jgi:hypothetical protein